MRNRWLIALAAIGLHISIGSVYAWSVLTTYYGRYGIYYVSNNMDLLPSYPDAWTICRLFRIFLQKK